MTTHNNKTSLNIRDTICSISINYKYVKLILIDKSLILFFLFSTIYKPFDGQTQIPDSIAHINNQITIRNKHPKTLNFNYNKYNNNSRFMQSPISVGDTTKISLEFVGKGDIQNSINQGSDIQANTGIGVILNRYNGRRHPLQDFELETSINIASTSDTISSNNVNNTLNNRRDFGSFVRNPQSSKQSVYLNSLFYFGYPLNKKTNDTLSYRYKDLNYFGKFSKIFSGASARIIASNTVWSHKGNSVNAGVIYGRIGLFHEFITDNVRIKGDDSKSEYSILIGANYSYSGIRGDITNNNNKTLMNEILNTNRTGYGGIELNMAIKLKNIRFEFQMPIVTNNEIEVEGLTNTQFIFSARFVGGFPMKID